MTEGRKAVSTVDETGQPYYYSTKEANQKIDCKNGIRLTGAMDIDTMTSFCREKGIALDKGIVANEMLIYQLYLARKFLTARSCSPTVRCW